MRRLAMSLVAVLVPGILLNGCGLELEDVPMPKLVSGPTYEVIAEFQDALNLPVDAPVKLEGATVGQVAAVEPGEYLARVTLELSEDVTLAGNSSAEIRLTSPMGTAFVQLFPGSKGQPLADGAVIPAKRTSEAPDIADLLTALSTVVTGGSFHDISTIIKQLNVALTGNAGTVKQLFRRLDRAVTDLNDAFPTVDALTASLNRLSTRLAADLPELSEGMAEMADLATSLEAQRETMMATMDALRRFEAVATPYTTDIRGNLLRNLDSLRTVLRTLADEKRNIDRIMAGLVAFSTGSDEASPGDFVNFDLTFLIDPEAFRATGGSSPFPAGGER